ncbi:MAG TPA: DUF5916 domain-containing protein, partial [Terriglobales bacterium]|nr:DUF5916 domain-containing protein [Terriglobales bacterium]
MRHRLVILLLLVSSAVAQTPAPAGASAYSIHIRKIPAKIVVDGRLDEAVWNEIEPVTSFTQTDPDLGQPISEKTEARIFYDDENIYFGFKCFDREPGKVIHRLGAHDASTGSDSVDILLDTFHDRRTGYYFSINSLGIQFDGLSDETNRAPGFASLDPTWDGIWYSAGVIQPWGWSAEVVIPFKSLRIPAASVQTWGFNMNRTIPRKNESASWVPVSRYDGIMKPSKAGTLTGIENIRVGHNLELIPYASTRYRNDAGSPAHEGFGGSAGLDARYALSPNLTANLTINPDFADTEADEFTSEISRFEIFFPEKRKFFTEGANYFTTPLTAFFSRRVGARLPDGEPQRIYEGGKLTGRADGWTIGALEALTQRTEFIDPDSGLNVTAPGAFFAVLRAFHGFGDKSAFGFVSVNRIQQQNAVFLPSGDLLSENESTQGIDLNILKGEHLSWSSQLLANLNATHPGFNPQNLGGLTHLLYDSETFTYEATGKFLGNRVDMSSTGFEPEVDRWSGQMAFTYKPFINRWGIRQIFISPNYDESNDTGGALQDAGADGVLDVTFKNFWTAHFSHNYDRVRFNEFTDLFTRLPGTRVYVTPKYRFYASTNQQRAFAVTFRYIWGKEVQFDENFYGLFRQYEVVTST